MIQLRSLILRLLLAFGLGLSLWIYVTFSENPDQTTTFREVPLRVEGKSPGLVLVDERGQPLPTDNLPTRLDLISVQADAQTLANLSRADIDAYVDLSGLSPGDYSRPVLARSRRNDQRLRFTEIQPASVPVRLERLITSTVPLSVVVRGNVPFVYERDEAEVADDLSSAEIIGPESLVSQVVEVRASVDIAGLTASFESSLPLEPLDASGAVVEGVSVNPSQIAISVPIRPTVGIKPVAVTAPEVLEPPAAGYEVTGISVSPPFVNLTGSSEALAEVRGITTVPLDLSGATRTLTRELDLLIPDGVSLFGAGSRRVQVTVSIAPIERPLSFSAPLPVQVVNIAPGLLLRSASPSQVLVELAANAGDVGAIDVGEGRALVDVSGLGPGTYDLEPALVLPPGMSLAGDIPPVTVVLVAPTAQPTGRPPQPSPTAGPTADDAEAPTTNTPIPETPTAPAPETPTAPAPKTPTAPAPETPTAATDGEDSAERTSAPAPTATATP